MSLLQVTTGEQDWESPGRPAFLHFIIHSLLRIRLESSEPERTSHMKKKIFPCFVANMLASPKPAKPAPTPVTVRRHSEAAADAAAPPASRRTLLACATLLAASPLLALPLRSSAALSPPSPVRLLHAVLNVADIKASARFFTEAYGVKRTRSRPGNEFVGFGDESEGAHFALEFSPLPPGASPAASPGFGGLVLAVDNPAKAVAHALAAGARRSGGGERCSGDAFAGCAVVGPEGIRVAFVKGDARAPRLARVVLLVPDVAASAAVFERALGFRVVPRQPGLSDRAAEDGAAPPAVLLGRGDGGTLLELRSAPAAPPSSDAPPLFDKVALSVPAGELAAYADAVREQGGRLVRAPFEVPGIGTHVALVDGGGVTLALVDSADFEKELYRR